ncbi:MAG TPA: hypothetical protein VFX20_18275 [Steroidobacteraceae bacterium]|nr:hypothetical protein [Steroidobacteraceae bacterium]
MSLPLKDLGRIGVSPNAHKVLTRIAHKEGMTLQKLARDVLEAYVRKAIHDAKLVLGQDADNPSDTEPDGELTEAHGRGRSGVR